jgi:hypothetical protein
VSGVSALSFQENPPVEADIKSVSLLKQGTLNYTAILPNSNLVGNEFKFTAKYEFSGNSV